MEEVTIQGIKANDHRILSRVITRIENDDYVQDQIFIDLYDQAQDAIRLGITGPPGEKGEVGPPGTRGAPGIPGEQGQTGGMTEESKKLIKELLELLVSKNIITTEEQIRLASYLY